MLVRRLAATLLMVGMLATLVVAARHDHSESLRGCKSTACLFCTGAAASSPAPPVVAPQHFEVGMVATRELPNPSPRYLLPLAHSGCAPPGGPAPLPAL